ncbi:MAG: nucleotidyltransferase domain-containing protein [Candidatus Aenigmarchaeota archaeon]|nr:nucleotidyltransferase domain-containing protein [Candidatus Aenigmarchaeota archaeon]MDI6722342.1 nucleotidyltransferase domain-containing protein [Candidatus Aenigmarchaeota archaeon]
MLRKEYEIIGPFVKWPWKKFTFREIKKLAGKKSESYVYNSLKKFVKTGILKEEKAGNVVLYSIELRSLKACIYSGIVAEHLAWSKNRIPYIDIDKISGKIPTPFYILIITGSYASGKQNPKSDIDMVIICDDPMEPQKIYAQLRQKCELNIPPIHLYVFKKSEFLEMLVNKEANYGKEIAENNLILSGGREYYGIISEAVQNGFNGEDIYRKVWE